MRRQHEKDTSGFCVRHANLLVREPGNLRCQSPPPTTEAHFLSLITILRSLHSRQRIGFPSKSAAVRGGRCRSARDQTRMRPSNEHVANSQPRTCARITAYASKRIRKHTATPVAASVCSRSEYSMDPSRRLHIFIVLSCEA